MLEKFSKKLRKIINLLKCTNVNIAYKDHNSKDIKKKIKNIVWFIYFH